MSQLNLDLVRQDAKQLNLQRIRQDAQALQSSVKVEPVPMMFAGQPKSIEQQVKDTMGLAAETGASYPEAEKMMAERTWGQDIEGALAHGGLQALKGVLAIVPSAQQTLNQVVVGPEGKPEVAYIPSDVKIDKIGGRLQLPPGRAISEDEFKKLSPDVAAGYVRYEPEALSQPKTQTYDEAHPGRLFEFHKGVSDLISNHPEWNSEPPKNLVDLIKSPRKLSVALTRSIPETVGALGLTLTGHPLAAATLVYAAEGEQAYDDVKNSGGTEEEANKARVMYGAPAAALEMFQLDKGIALTKELRNLILAKSAKKIATAGAEKAAAKSFVTTVVEQAATEVLQGAWQEKSEEIAAGIKSEGTWKDYVDRRMQEAFLATLMTAGFAGAGGVVGVAAKRRGGMSSTVDAEGWQSFSFSNESTARKFSIQMMADLNSKAPTVDIQQNGNTVRIRPMNQPVKAETKTETKPEKPAVPDWKAKEDELYAQLMAKAETGDEAAWEQLQILVQRLNEPTYDELLDRAIMGDTEAAQRIQEGRFNPGVAREQAKSLSQATPPSEPTETTGQLTEPINEATGTAAGQGLEVPSGEVQGQAKTEAVESGTIPTVPERQPINAKSLPDLIAAQGRDKVEELLGEWDRDAHLSEDGAFITTYSDPRSQTGKIRASTREFLKWLREPPVERAAQVPQAAGLSVIPKRIQEQLDDGERPGVGANWVDSGQVKLPEGYVREGQIYVFRKEATNAEAQAIPAESRPASTEAAPAKEVQAVPVQEGKQREPWEMTSDEYNKTLGMDKRFIPPQPKRQGARVVRVSDNETITTGEHGKAVWEALQSGKPVPENVLADYPELVKALGRSKSTESQPEGAKEPWQTTRTEWMNAERDRRVVEKEGEWKKKYGLSWYNDKSVLNAQKRFMREAFDQHGDAVKRAVSEGVNVPSNVLQDYKGQDWADAAIAKLQPSEPVEAGAKAIETGQEVPAEKRVAEMHAPDHTLITLLSIGEAGRDGFKVIDEAGNVLAQHTKAELQELLKGEGLATQRQIIPAIQKIMFDEALAGMASETEPEEIKETPNVQVQAQEQAAKVAEPIVTDSSPITAPEKSYLVKIGMKLSDILHTDPIELRRLIAFHQRGSERAGGFLRFDFSKDEPVQWQIDKAVEQARQWLSGTTAPKPETVVERTEPDDPATKERERGFVTTLKEQGFIPQETEATYHVRNTEALAIKAANLVRNDMDAAERMAMTGTDDNAIAVMSELMKEYRRRSQSATDQKEKVKWAQKMIEMSGLRSPVLTEAGRTAQAASIILLNTPEGLINFAAKTIEQYNETHKKNPMPGLSPEMVAFWMDELKAIEAMPDGIAKAKRFGKILNAISALTPSTWFQKVMAVIRAGLLTGIRTSGLNTVSNLFHGVSETVKDVPGAAYDTVLSLFTGKRTLAASAQGSYAGLKKGVNEGYRYIRTGWGERDNIASKLEYKRVHFDSAFGKYVLQPYVDFVFRILGAEDQPFYYGAFARSLANQAVAQAKTEGKGQTRAQEILEKPTDEMFVTAIHDAEVAVFMNSTWLGDIASYIVKRASWTQPIIPFTRTPSAIAMQVVNYTPVGAVLSIYENIRNFDQRAFAQELGRATIGTGILWLGYELFKQGLLVLDRPETERERELWKLENRQANSIKIGNEWRSVQVLGPAGNLLVVGGHIANGLKKTGSVMGAATEAFAGGGKSFSEQTFLRGLNVAMEALTQPERSSQSFVSTMAGMVVPTIVADIAKVTDSVERRSTGWGLERIMSRLPGLRETLEPQVNVFGQDLPRYGGNVLQVMLDPTRPAKIRQDSVVDEIRRLWDAGYTIASPTQLGSAKGYKCLTDKQNTELWHRSGEMAYVGVFNAMNDEEYIQSDDEDKAKLIDNSVQDAKTTARVEMAYQILSPLSESERILKTIELREGKLLTNEVAREVEKLL